MWRWRWAWTLFGRVGGWVGGGDCLFWLVLEGVLFGNIYNVVDIEICLNEGISCSSSNSSYTLPDVGRDHSDFT